MFGRGFPVRGHVLVDDLVEVEELILTIVLRGTFDCGVINAVADFINANTTTTNSILYLYIISNKSYLSPIYQPLLHFSSFPALTLQISGRIENTGSLSPPPPKK